MGKVKLLLDVIEDLRSLADSLDAVAEAMTHSDPPAEVPEKVTLTPSTSTHPEENAPPQKKSMSKEELRAFLGEKSLAGHRDAVQALVRKYGGKKFSDIDPKHYPALQKDAEELPDAT